MTTLAVGDELTTKSGDVWEVQSGSPEKGYVVQRRVPCNYCLKHGFKLEDTHDVDVRPNGYHWASTYVYHKSGRICQACFDYLRDGNAVRYHRKGTINGLGERD